MTDASSTPKGKRILSGTQPTGELHIGNYFGAIRQYIALQDGNEAAYFIADLHTLTTVRDAEALRSFTRGVALDYLALGVDPQESILYRQSDLPEAAELQWILGTVTPMGLLARCHAYKDKLAEGGRPDLGLFAYPVLMAADILIHRADLVPVGQDQKQHLEVTRDVAVKFNQTYGDVLHLPEPYILKDLAIVPGIDGRKMSKSYRNGIHMFAKENALEKEIMRIVSDSTPVGEPKDPDRSHVYSIWCLFASADEQLEMAESFRKGGVGYGAVKKDILGRLLDYFGPARERREELEKNRDYLEDVLREGARRARERAAPLIDAVRDACGVGAPRS
ncbi:MAG: tryptophan--tRNA ligase [Myxococcota bacterium]